MPPEPVPTNEPDLQRQQRLLAARTTHWRRTRRLTFVLMALWLATGFCTVFFARELSRVTIFGWPLSFYMAAQGASLICLAIIGIYAWRMRRYDRDLARTMGDNAGVAGVAK
jgi:putative solute:sodium symporter small subunit